MKRTLTAVAAVAVSSTGTVGFAGTAAAATAPESPARLSANSNLAQTALHAGEIVHPTKPVGTVIPLEEQSSGRSGARFGEASQEISRDLVRGNSMGKTLDNPAKLLKDAPVGDLRPIGETLPAERSGGAQVSALAGGVLERANPVRQAAGGAMRGLPGKDLGTVAQPVGQIVGVVGSVSPGSPAGNVTGLLKQEPLSGVASKLVS